MRNILVVLMLAVLIVAPAAAQDTEPAAQALSEADYVSTVDQLTTLIEQLIGLVPAGALTFFGVVLTVLAGAAYVLVKLTPSKADDEFVERIVAAVFARLNATNPQPPAPLPDVSRDEVTSTTWDTKAEG